MFGKTRVAIMGTGNIASVMARTLKHTKGAVCYAVGSRSQEKADEFASQYGVKKAYGSYEELVSDPKVDLVYIATPHSEHFANAKLAIGYGKAVLCEKPFTLNEKQGAELFRYAEENKVLICEAIWTRFLPFNETIKRVIGGGMIGEPTMLTANLGYAIADKKRINDPSLGGGALLDVGIYPINFASMIFGDDITDIDAICSYNQNGVDVQDGITLRYRNGKLAVLNCSVLATSDRKGIIYGSKGFIVIENINNYESLTVYDNEYKKTGYYKRQKQVSGYEYEVISCIRALKSGWLECPEMPHNETLKMLNIMDFIRKQTGVKYPQEMNNSENGRTEKPAEMSAGVYTDNTNTSMENSNTDEALKADAAFKTDSSFMTDEDDNADKAVKTDTAIGTEEYAKADTASGADEYAKADTASGADEYAKADTASGADEYVESDEYVKADDVSKADEALKADEADISNKAD